MTHPPRLPAVLLGAALAAGLAAATSAPAHALPLLARARIYVDTPTPNILEICPTGHVDDGGTTGRWVFTLNGARSNGTPLHAVIVSFGSTFAPPCLTYDTYGTPAGSWRADLTFAATVTASHGNGVIGVSDVTTLSTAVGGWTTATGPQYVGYDT